MKILITGNMGYIGPTVVQRLRTSYPTATIVGLDMGYFAACLTAANYLPECRVDEQMFVDVRSVSKEMLQGVDAVVYLAAISNDPMGASFEAITLDVNHRAAVAIAQLAREAGAGSFVFASSCSVYGFAEGRAKTEESAVNPLTAYAKSKVGAEQDLAALARSNFAVTCLRFATACGMSERLRLDLVLNDFVASAITAKKIMILSDGTPWRPLIHIKDMARAIDWGVQRKSSGGGEFLAVNAGSDGWNYQVRDLAAAVSKAIPNVEISINPNAQPDKRSYRVSFEKFRNLAPQYQPEIDLHAAIDDLRQGLQAMGFADQEFRNSHLIRLNVLKDLKARGCLGEDLRWVPAK
ncbi:MAG TPA: SDR family oxidoreductase [Nitrospira sp.]|nr:SDR family oxidoreductase [Nitrospira sp.]